MIQWSRSGSCRASQSRLSQPTAGWRRRLRVDRRVDTSTSAQQVAKVRADAVQPVDEGAEGGVFRVARACRAQVGDRLAGELIGPGRVVARAGGGIGEEPPDDVALGCGQGGEVAEQGGGHPVPGEHVVAGIADQGRGVVQPFNQVQDAWPHLISRTRAESGLGVREMAQVGAFVVGQPQRPADRGEHLGRRRRPPALLQPDVVVDRHAGQLRDLLSAQARGPASGPLGQPDIGRSHLGAAVPEKRRQLGPIGLIHIP